MIAEIGYRAAAALSRASSHEVLMEFSRGRVVRAGGAIVWFDCDVEAFSPWTVRTGDAVSPFRGFAVTAQPRNCVTAEPFEEAFSPSTVRTGDAVSPFRGFAVTAQPRNCVTAEPFEEAFSPWTVRIGDAVSPFRGFAVTAQPRDCVTAKPFEEAFSPWTGRTGDAVSPFRGLAVTAQPRDCVTAKPFEDAVAGFLKDHNPQRLIGLGHGLTPSGDDFLGGFALVRHRLGRPMSFDTRDTHEISRARLQMHLSGEGTRAEVRFVDALLNDGDTEQAASILRRHGHSSGDDFMRGARAAAESR